MFDEDLDAFLDSDEHAIECVIIDTQDIIAGIFDRPFSDDLDIQGFTPSLTCKSSDVTDKGLRRGTRIEVGTTVYRVVTFEPDGTGMTRVQLETDA